jgi:hypothetical protein
MAIRWRRGGSSTDTWSGGGTDVLLCPVTDGVKLWFSIPAAGGGLTNVEVIVESNEFDRLTSLLTPSSEKSEIEMLKSKNAELQEENKRLMDRILNESVRPDRVDEFRKRVMEAVAKAITETT